MRIEAGRVGLSFLTLIGGAGIALGGCVASANEPLKTSGTGGMGNTGGRGTLTEPPDGGPFAPDVGTVCTADGPVAPPGPIMGGGPQPQIPAAITQAATPLPPLSGGTLLALADGKTFAASDPERDQVHLVDTSAGSVRNVALQAGDEPGRLAQDGTGLLHLVLRRGGGIATIDPATATLGARQTVCSAPRGIVYQKDGDLLHVACAGGELVSLPAAGGAATRTVTLDRDLRDVVLGGGGGLLVSTFRKAEVLVVDASGAVTSRMQPGSGTVITVMGLPQMRTPSVAWRMVALDETTGSVAMLHQTGTTDLIDPVAGGYAGQKGCGGIVQPGVSVMTPGQPNPGVVGSMQGLSLTIDLAVSPDHQKVAMAVAGNSTGQGFTVVQQSLTAVTMTPPTPCGATGSDIPAAQPPGQVVAVAYSQAGVLYAQTREPATLWRADTNTTVSLASDSRADTGHFIFHVNAGGGLACASCHPEGGEDGRVWNFVCTKGRRTQSIRGGISATAPFHWDGAEHDFSTLMNDVFTGRMAGPSLDDAHKMALATWIDTIPALPPTAGLDPAAVARGQAIFTSGAVGCAVCHAGTLLTNNMTVDVGTGQAFQVPSLRGVSWRAPYLHDGCAATLADRFTSAGCGGGDRHGITSTLTSAQLGDLQTYLQSL